MTRCRVTDLVVDRGDRRVLDGISLSIDAGEIVALVGPNGAGKTTLLEAITGVVAPTAGQITVEGRAIDGLGQREVARRVASVPQNTAVGFDLTVEDLVGMGRTPHRSRFAFAMSADDREAIDAAIDRLGLDSLADRPLTAISGGQRQRAYLARALAQDAPVLALDEPTASLDIAHARSILETVSDLVDGDRAVIAAIHDLDLAARYADRMIVIADGGIHERGPPDAVVRSGAIEATFGTPVGVATDPVTGAPTVRPIGSDDGDHVHVAGGGPTAAATIARLAEAGRTITAGPVREGDIAARAAHARDISVVQCSRAGPLDDRGIDRARDFVAESDAIVLADVAAGHREVAQQLLEVADRCVAVADRSDDSTVLDGTDTASPVPVAPPDRVVEMLDTEAARIEHIDETTDRPATPAVD
ncbi:MAG: ABC transporter ATP-binding protein [Halococcoides sp.]